MARSRTSGVMTGLAGRHWLLLGLVAAIGTTARADRIVVFADDMEGGSLREEWSGGRIEQAPSFTKYLGRMTDQTLGLNVPAPAEVSVRGGKVTYYMRFDLFTLDGWKGRSGEEDTRFEVMVGERLMFSHSLSNQKGGTFREPSEGPAVMEYGAAEDCVYRGVLVAFELDADDELNVRFRALGLASQRDYSELRAALGAAGAETRIDMPAWGIDNVEIWCDTDHLEGGSTGREVEPPFFDGSLGALAGGGADPFRTQGTASAGQNPETGYRIPGPREMMPMEFGSGKDDPAPFVMPSKTENPATETPSKDTPVDDPVTPEETSPRPDPTPTPSPTPDPTPTPSPEVTPVPGPGSLALFVTAALSTCGRKRRAA